MTTQIKTQDIGNSTVTLDKMNCLTTKGDVLVYGTSHNRLAAGTDGQILASDSTQANGLRWTDKSTFSTITSVPAGNTISNTASETLFASNYSIAANSLAVGQVLRITAAGTFSTLLSVSLTLKIKIGSVVINTTGALVLTSGLSNSGWRIQDEMVVTAVGSSGALESHGVAFFSALASPVVLTNTNSVTVNTASTSVLQLSATWSALSVGNSITLRQFIVEVLR